MSEYQPLEELEEAEQRPFNKQYFLRMLGYIRGYKRQAALTALGILLASGVPLFEPYLLGKVVDDGIIPGDMAPVQRIALLLAVLHLLGWIGGRTRTWTASIIGQGILFDLRQDLIPSFQFSRGLRDFLISGRITFRAGAQGQ